MYGNIIPLQSCMKGFWWLFRVAIRVAALQQVVNQQVAANQQALLQVRQAQQGGAGAQQQLLFHPGQGQQMQSGQAQAFQVSFAST